MVSYLYDKSMGLDETIKRLKLEEAIKRLDKKQQVYLTSLAVAHREDRALTLASIIADINSDDILIWVEGDEDFKEAQDIIRRGDYSIEGFKLTLKLHLDKFLEMLIYLATRGSTDNVKLEAIKYCLNLLGDGNKANESLTILERYFEGKETTKVAKVKRG